MKKFGWKSVAVALAALPLIASASHAGERRVDVAGYGPAWAGFYVGAHAGLAFTSVEASGHAGPLRASIDEDSTDFGGGLQVGYNFLMSNGLLLGVEGDSSFLNGDVATLRGRLGQVVDDKLFYATAGVAFFDDDIVDSTGFVVGAGVEVDLDRYWKNVTAGVEGLYSTASDEVSCNVGPVNCGADVDVSSFAIRGRVNYHFGGNDGQLK
jgi:opacity protein-like surface antigen